MSDDDFYNDKIVVSEEALAIKAEYFAAIQASIRSSPTPTQPPPAKRRRTGDKKGWKHPVIGTTGGSGKPGPHRERSEKILPDIRQPPQPPPPRAYTSPGRSAEMPHRQAQQEARQFTSALTQPAQPRSLYVVGGDTTNGGLQDEIARLRDQLELVREHRTIISYRLS